MQPTKRTKAEVLKDAERFAPLAESLIHEHAERVYAIATRDGRKDVVKLTQRDATTFARVIAVYMELQRRNPGKPVHKAPEWLARELDATKGVVFTSVFILQGPEPGMLRRESVESENKFHVLLDKIERAASKAHRNKHQKGLAFEGL